MQWLKAGDANTKFFHSRANHRRNKNYIARLSDGTSTLSSHETIANHLFSFFSNQLGVEQVSSDSINLQMIYSSECVDLSCLHLPFTLDEVKRTIFSSAPEKAPGPDGLPMFFYQRFWNLIKDDILDVFNYFYNGAANLQVINTGWVCLLPKRKDASSAADYRPISLVHSVAKLISKVLATRLQAVMNQLINPYQAAFIKGRFILDNFNSAHILVHHLHSSKERNFLRSTLSELSTTLIGVFFSPSSRRGASAAGGSVGYKPYCNLLILQFFSTASWARLSPANGGFARGILFLPYFLFFVLMCFLE